MSRICSSRNLQTFSDGDVRKEVAHALAVVCPADRLGDGAADVDDLELGATLKLVAERHRVGHDDLREAALVDRVDSGSLHRRLVSSFITWAREEAYGGGRMRRGPEGRLLEMVMFCLFAVSLRFVICTSIVAELHTLRMPWVYESN